MTTPIFPSLPGVAYPVTRTPMWSSKKQVSVAGLETSYSYWSYPRYQWDLIFTVLRSGANYLELQELLAFFNEQQGGALPFLYQDADDNAVTGQGIATGDGVTQNFQMVKSFGGFVEPCLAPNITGTVNIYLNGVLQNSGYTVNGFFSSGSTVSATPGVLSFVEAPGSGVAIAADFGYYYPCRFVDDKIPFGLFASQLYEAKKISFLSIKGIQ